MNRLLTSLFGALEGAVAVLIGLAIPLVMLTVLWATEYQLGVDWSVFWQSSAALWLLGNGVDAVATIPAETLAALGLGTEALTFTLSAAPLGFALITVVVCWASARRMTESAHWEWGIAVVPIAVGALGYVIGLAVADGAVVPDTVQTWLMPGLLASLGVVLGLGSRWSDLVARDMVPGWVLSIRDTVPETARAIVARSTRIALAAVVGVVAVSAVVLGILLALNYGTVIGFYEKLGTGVVGGVAVTLGQLALLPTLVIWTASWLLGPGFAVGAATSVDPSGTVLGPVPPLPVFAALPSGTFEFGFVALLVPLLAAFLAGYRGLPRRLLAERAEDGSRPQPELDRWLVIAGVAALSAIIGGLILAGLAWAASGSWGPGRLEHTGPDPVSVLVWSAIVFVIGGGLGLVCAQLSGSAAREAVEEQPSRRSTRRDRRQDALDTEAFEPLEGDTREIAAEDPGQWLQDETAEIVPEPVVATPRAKASAPQSKPSPTRSSPVPEEKPAPVEPRVDNWDFLPPLTEVPLDDLLDPDDRKGRGSSR